MVSPSSRNILRVGIVSPVATLDLWGTVDFVNLLALWQMFETPYSPGPAGAQPAPLLFAEPLQRRASGGSRPAFAAPVRRDVRFWDGTQLTAAHVCDCLRRSKSFTALAEIEACGEEVLITTKQDEARLDVVLTQPGFWIAIRHGSSVVGTGAYMPAPDSTPTRLHLVENPHFRHPAGIEELEFTVYPRDPDGSARELRRAVDEGRVDFTSFLRWDEAQGLSSARVSSELGTSVAILYFHTERPPLRDRRVRRAMAHAIDRMALSSLCFPQPLAHTATGLLPPALGRLPDGVTYDLAAAKSLLAEAGVRPGGRPLRMFVISAPRPYLPRPQEVAESIKQQLGKLGLAVEIRVATSLEDYFEGAAGGDHDLVLAGCVADTPYAIDLLDSVLGSERIPGGDKTVLTNVNLSRWRNPAADAELARLRATRSSDTFRLGELLRAELPLVPLLFGATTVVHSWDLKNCPPSFMTNPFFYQMKLG
jgi:ABC-type transport system substrate-binding protein